MADGAPNGGLSGCQFLEERPSIIRDLSNLPGAIHAGIEDPPTSATDGASVAAQASCIVALVNLGELTFASTQMSVENRSSGGALLPVGLICTAGCGRPIGRVELGSSGGGWRRLLADRVSHRSSPTFVTSCGERRRSPAGPPATKGISERRIHQPTFFNGGWVGITFIHGPRGGDIRHIPTALWHLALYGPFHPVMLIITEAPSRWSRTG